jgi:FtsZ-binding cell division protein ZapB
MNYKKIMKRLLEEEYISAEKEYRTTYNEIEELIAKHNSLGFFKNKEKNEIYSKIKELEKELDNKFFKFNVLGGEINLLQEMQVEELKKKKEHLLLFPKKNKK